MNTFMKRASYIVCTSPRSGSTLLCRLLAATGIAGDPESLFYRPSVEDWMTRMNVQPGEMTERDCLERVVQAAIRKGRGRTPVFGLRQQQPSFAFLCRKLAVLHPEAATDLERIERTFGPTRFIHLTRPDKVDQAVSYLKAVQSGLWHVAVDGSEWERTSAPEEPVYDAGAIRDWVDTFESYDRSWNAWFNREGIDPVRLSYDDLSADPKAVLRLVLDNLGLDPQKAVSVEAEIRKMADETNRDWVARFREEMGHR